MTYSAFRGINLPIWHVGGIVLQGLKGYLQLIFGTVLKKLGFYFMKISYIAWYIHTRHVENNDTLQKSYGEFQLVNKFLAKVYPLTPIRICTLDGCIVYVTKKSYVTTNSVTLNVSYRAPRKG